MGYKRGILVKKKYMVISNYLLELIKMVTCWKNEKNK